MPARRWLGDRGIASCVELLALLPAIAMAFEVAASPRLQQLDYWSVLLRITNPDGTYDIGGVWDLQNEHPLIVPSFFYWIDAKWFGGDNRVLGYLTVAIAVATVLLLRSALPRVLPALLRAGLVVATSALVFSLHGIHNFALGMSGSAWLTANLLVVGSLLLARRRRWVLAWSAGVLACASYGTGFAVWPALFLLAVMHGERWWRRIATLLVGAATVAVWLTMKPSVMPGQAPADDVGSLLYTFLTLIGHVWTGRSTDLAAIAGGAVLCGLVALLTVPVARTRGLWLWWALASYGLLACAMIAAARVDFGTDIGLASRYTSLSALTSVPLLVIVATVAYRRSPGNAPRFAVASVAIGLVGFTLGAPMVAVVREAVSDSPLRAIAFRAELDDRFWIGVPDTERIAPRLDALDHYPFTDDFTLGCGGPELGDRVDPDDMTAMPLADEDEPGPSGAVDSADTRGDTTLLRGWVTGGHEGVRCVLFTDATGEVTGGGQYHLARPDVKTLIQWVASDTGFAVIAPTDPAGRVVVVLDNGRMFWLPGKADGEAPE
jgi:hypothetical protein